jgi:hypothetical protein
LSLYSQRFLEDFFCSSRQRSLRAVREVKVLTLELMQSCFREAREMCFMSSVSVRGTAVVTETAVEGG